MAMEGSSRPVTIPLDATRIEQVLDEAVLLVKQLGARVDGLSHRGDRPALILHLPVTRPKG
jgi:hypothetical protein